MMSRLEPPASLPAANEFAVELAAPADDEAIQRLLASSAVPGRVVLSSARRPSYFLSCGTMGAPYQVGVVRHRPTGQIVGLGYRGLQPRFVNGRVETLGYITDLVVDARFQGRWVYPRLLRLLRELHQDGLASGYLVVIGGGHQLLIRNVLPTASRSYLPVVRELGALWTLALIARPTAPTPTPGYEIRRGSRGDLAAIVALLRQQGARRQLYPAYREADFATDAPLTRGFRVDDFLLAFRAGRLVGVLGLWDRSDFRQTIVQSYTAPHGWVRPLYDGAARLVGAQPLPRPGQPLRCIYASFTAILGDDPAVYRGLLRQTRAEAARRGYGYLMVGLTAADPLLPTARRFLHLPYRSRLYTVSYPDQPALYERLDGRPPYLELAAT